MLARRSGPVRFASSAVRRLAERCGLDDGRRRWETGAHAALLQENFADITHVAVVDPFIAPPVLSGSPPPLEVEVTETTVSFSRNYPPAPIATWHAELLGLPTDAEHAQRESGAFVTPGLWVDRWHVVDRR